MILYLQLDYVLTVDKSRTGLDRLSAKLQRVQDDHEPVEPMPIDVPVTDEPLTQTYTVTIKPHQAGRYMLTLTLQCEDSPPIGKHPLTLSVICK